MNQALIIVDIQNDYFPSGKMELVGMEKAASNAKSAALIVLSSIEILGRAMGDGNEKKVKAKKVKKKS